MSLDHEVIIRPDPAYFTYASYDACTIIGPLREWLYENIKGGWNWDYERRGAPLQKYVLAFRFEDRAEAAAFRLVWG